MQQEVTSLSTDALEMALSSKYRAAHDDPQGPGDGRPSAMQIIKDEGLEGKLGGLIVIVTGANSGIGTETAKALHAAGCEVSISLAPKLFTPLAACLPALRTSPQHAFALTLSPPCVGCDASPKSREGGRSGQDN